ncbi:hypothetical protein [Absidia glauca]|uniref:Uncharacterized protein n=1 Tax=Absidia glauca TaxID=4829 RepID=A0A163KMG8_ABSGL|nr:hypothetical protein [Absidia glauca]
MSLSRASSFSANSSSASSSRYDNSTMVTSRNLKCMPSDDEDDFDEDDEEDDNEENRRDCKGDNLTVYDTIKHPFFSVDSENVANHHAQANDNVKKVTSNSVSSSDSCGSSDFDLKRQKHKPAMGVTNQHQQQLHHVQQQQQWCQKQQQRHSIGLPISGYHPPQGLSRYASHSNINTSHPITTNSNRQHHKPMTPPVPLLSVNMTLPSTPTTPPLNFNNTAQPLSHQSVTSPTNTSSHYLRHRSNLSGVDLIMAREQFEQQKKKTKQKKKWDSTHAPIGGLLAQLPQQGQHTISFQQQQLQQKYQQQMQMQQLQYQQQCLQQVHHPMNGSYQSRRNSHLNPSSLVLPRSPTSSMARW